MNFEPLFHNLITSGIKTPSRETLSKVKALNVFLLVLIVFGPLLGLFYFFIGADLLCYTAFGAALLGIADIVLLRTTKQLVVTANFAFFILWAALFVIRWHTGAMSEGGIVLLSWIWNAALLIMAVFITGYLWGTIWGSVIFLETGTAVCLFRTGYEFPNFIPPDILPIYSLGAYLAGLLVILLIAFLYEKEKERAVEAMQNKSRALVESKRYIDTILSRFPFPTFVVDGEHRVIQWNPACQKMTGVSPDQVIGKQVPSSLWADSNGSLADMLIDDPDFITERFSESIIAKTDSGCFDLGIPLPSIGAGIDAVITVAPIYDAHGSVKAAIETIQDMSSQQKDNYAAYDKVGDDPAHKLCPIFRVNSKGKISFWNKACEDTFGYSSSEMIGESPFRFVSKSTRDPFRETIVRVLKGQSFKGKGWKYYSSSGEPIHVMVIAYLVQSPDGDFKECVVMNTNITPLTARMKELEKDSAEAKERLKSMADEYALLRRNLATYIRKKED
ncbi:MAG: PAS domain-containing protein [Thermodesulfobacteriota bacterium]